MLNLKNRKDRDWLIRRKFFIMFSDVSICTVAQFIQSIPTVHLTVKKKLSFGGSGNGIAPLRLMGQ
jgi:hypothetical protein